VPFAIYQTKNFAATGTGKTYWKWIGKGRAGDGAKVSASSV